MNDRHLARADERRGHRRGADDLVRELALLLGEAVAVRRDDGVRSRRVDAVVHELESIRGRSLAARIGRAVQQRAVERERRGAAAVERGAGDGAEPDERLRELEVRHPDAVARPAAVGDDEQDPPVGELADTGARGARRQLARREGLVGAEDRAAVADEHRATADGIRDPCPLRPEDEPQRQLGSDRRLLGEPRRGSAARHEHCAVARDRRAARACDMDHRAEQVGVRRRRRERSDDDLGRAGSGRRRRAVAGSEERERVRAGRLVEVVQRAPLAEPAPGAEELDPTDVEGAFGRDADARAVAVRRAVDDAAAHEDAARPPGRGEEVAVDADHRRGRGETLLHRGHALEALDRLVREHGAKRVEPGRARAANDVDRDRPVRRELDAALVADAGHQGRLGRRGRGEHQGEKPSDEKFARHDPEGG